MTISNLALLTLSHHKTALRKRLTDTEMKSVPQQVFACSLNIKAIAKILRGVLAVVMSPAKG